MKLIIWAVAFLMIILGNFALMSEVHKSPINVGRLSMGTVITVWGAFLLWYNIKSYRGGAATIVGVFLLGMAVHYVVESLFQATSVNLKEESSLNMAIALCALAGLALVRQGHKIHRLYNQKELSEDSPD